MGTTFLVVFVIPMIPYFSVPIKYKRFFYIFFILMILLSVASPIVRFIASSKVSSNLKLAGFLFFVASIIGGVTSIKGVLYVIAGIMCFDIDSREKDVKKKVKGHYIIEPIDKDKIKNC